ncbi:DinB family protein [Pseudonocardia sp.]|uniref:DinB family protein n=1 Tax=Pseudonocardia sp. TaxID=60912 RepID=UPI002606BFE4|nr:DinB family protein [Pseudonocardia sp.]
MTTNTERVDLLETLATHRGFLLHTVQGLTDEQARQRTTVSELTLGGLIKHVARTEAGWLDFIERGTAAMEATADSWAEHADGFVLRPDETLAGVLAEYADVAKRTDALVASLPSLDVAHPLPEAPWFPTGATRSARRVFTHIVAETAQHAGHADILREALDGQKTMG